MTASNDLRLAALYVEYGTLRDEVLARSRVRFEILTVLIAASTLILATDSEWLVLVFAPLMLFLTVWIGALISRCSARLAVIEQQVNVLVADEARGEAMGPMGWETLHQRSALNRLGRWLSGSP